MEKVTFVIWMIGWPLVSSITDYLSHLTGRKYSEGAIGFAAIFSLIIWLYVGALLYY